MLVGKDNRVKYQEVDYVEMSPDVYGGDNFDKIIPRWIADIEKEGEEVMGDTLTLDAKHYAPGTKIVVYAPECPECETLADIPGTKCYHCDFDWEEWTFNEYS